MKLAIQTDLIEQKILLIRGHRVMLDRDLARLYGVTTKRLNEQVKRNRRRFPPDFIFQLSSQEKTEVVAICDHLWKLKFSSMLPYAFTEHGAIMVAGVLNTKRAIEVSVFVVRAFVKLREMLASQKGLARKLAELEQKVAGHDEHIQSLFQAIRQLMAPSTPKRKKIGFHVRERIVRYSVSGGKSARINGGAVLTGRMQG